MKWMALLMFYSEKVPILRYTLKRVEACFAELLQPT
jgi:hypothetical protein